MKTNQSVTPIKTLGETAATEGERLHTPDAPDYAGYCEPNHFADKRFTMVTFYNEKNSSGKKFNKTMEHFRKKPVVPSIEKVEEIHQQL